MKYHQAFRLESCPRYEGEYADDRIQENLQFQAAFWNAIRLAMRGSDSGCVELRFAACPNTRSIDVTLFVRNTADESFMREEVLSRLLPHEYRWTRIDPHHDGAQDVWAHSDRHPWKGVRLVRRVEFFNLPDRSGRWIGVTPEKPPASSGEAEFVNVADSPHGLLGDERFIPEYRSTNIGRQFREGTLCVPMLGSLNDFAPDRNRLCEELQMAAPAVVSIAIHPVGEPQLREDRMRADFLRRWIEPMGNQIFHSDFAMIRDLLPNFDRYWLTADRLCNVTIRVAAREPGNAHSVAHWMASQFGGMPIFEVIEIGRDYNSPEDLALPQDGSLGDRFDQWLAGLGVEPSDSYRGFLRRMPHLYTLEEAQRILQLPVAREPGLAGISTYLTPPFYRPPSRLPDEEIENRIRVGVVQSSGAHIRRPVAERGTNLPWHSMATSDLSKHALIVGTTGSGKSVTTQFLVRELDRKDIDFFVIEPVKTEYFDALTGPCAPPLKSAVARYGFEGEADGTCGPHFLTFDPMRLQTGVTVARHVSYLKSCFAAAFPMDEVLALIFGNGLAAYYTESKENGGCGLKLLDRGGSKVHTLRKDGCVLPSFHTFAQFFLGAYLPKALAVSQQTEFSVDAMNAFVRRFESLQNGQLGLAFDRADRYFRQRRRHVANAWNPFELLFEQNTVLELDAIADNSEKSLVMAFLLTFLFEKRQAEALLARAAKTDGDTPATPSNSTRHVVVVEEAHRLLSANTKGKSKDLSGESASEKAVSLFVDMLAEIRAFRQGLVIVEQIPTKIVPETVKNTNLKIMHRLTAQDDRDFLGEAMNFNDEQKRFVRSLNTGQCVVFEEHIDQPLLLRTLAPDQWPSSFPQQPASP